MELTALQRSFVESIESEQIPRGLAILCCWSTNKDKIKAFKIFGVGWLAFKLAAHSDFKNKINYTPINTLLRQFSSMGKSFVTSIYEGTPISCVILFYRINPNKSHGPQRTVHLENKHCQSLSLSSMYICI